MKKPYVLPTETNTDHPGDRDASRLDHPAFGNICMTIVRGGGSGEVLFGSDVKHNQRVRIEITRANVVRSLSTDWIHHGSRDTICEFEMSHAQFAQFITSQGCGSGTPITLQYAPEMGVKVAQMPGILPIEPKIETLRRELEASAKERIAALGQQVAQLGELINSGKTSKKDLARIHNELARHCQQLPGSLGFVIDMGQEMLEKVATSIKIDVESFIGAAARRIGLKRISQLAELEEKAGNLPEIEMSTKVKE